MTDLEFRILGPLEVVRHGEAVPLAPGLPRALLGLLLVHANQVVPTDRLLEELWNGEPPASAGHALQVYVSNLRRLLEPDRHGGVAPQVLVTRRPGYLLVAPPEQRDAARFELLVGEGGQALDEGRLAEGSRILAGALGLWRGPVLADLGDAPFVANEATRLEELRLGATERWAEAELALGHHGELVSELEALVRRHPFRERLWARLIVALYRSGRQADALQAYQRLRTVLGEELGLEPSPELRQLETAVLRHDPDLAAPASVGSAPAMPGTPRAPGMPETPGAPGIGNGAAAAVPPSAERTPFVGREPERAELRGLMDRAVAGEGGLVLIGGEPGVGKSRLSEELAAEARGRFRVLVGHCYESGRDLPYMPWVELIETAMADTPTDDFRQALGDDAPEFARLVPELRRLFHDIPPPVEVPPEQQRRYTFNSIRDYVTRVSRTQPRLYVLEDLHWADESTLLLLEHLAERLPTIPCLVLGTYRDPPIEISPQLAETLSRLVRLRKARLMSLGRHSEDEVEALLGALSGQSPPPEVRATIYGETEGNAFFVEEVFRHLAEGGRLLDEDGNFRPDIEIKELDVPANVRLVTGQRVERLSATTQQALGIAAVAGRHVSFELLEAVAEVAGDELIDALDEAERASLIVTRAASGHQEEYWFVHELTRQTFLTRLPAARRRRHHLRVADALERLFADDLSAQAGTIAQHLVEAGSSADPKRLFGYLVLAGKRALESAAFEDALRHLHRAGALGEHAPPAERAEMLFLLGMAERSAGNWGGAVDPWRRAIEIYERLGNADVVSRTCVAAAYSVAWAARFGDAHELAQRSLAILGDRVSGDHARLLATSGFCVAGRGDYEHGMEEIAQALSIAEELDDSDALAFVLLWKSITHMAYMEMHESVADLRRAAEITRHSDEVWQHSSIIGFIGENVLNLGGFDEARQIRQELLPVAERLGNSGALWNCLLVEGAVRFCTTGDPDGVADLGRRAIDLCEHAGLGWASWGWSWLALAEFLRGNWETAILHAEQAEALALPTMFRGKEWALHFEYLAYSGRREEALAMLEARRSELPRPGEPGGWGPWLMLLSAVEGLVVLGERDQAAGLYPNVRHCIERTRVLSANPGDAKLLERIAGMAAAAGGDWEAAEAHFTNALDQAEKMPHRPEQAHTRRFFAAMLLDRDGPGDRAEARRLISEAEALYREMGMPRHEALLPLFGR